MEKLVELTIKQAEKEASKLGQVIGTTQEDEVIICWYNDSSKSTKCVIKEIPFYFAFEEIRKAKAVLL